MICHAKFRTGPARPATAHPPINATTVASTAVIGRTVTRVVTDCGIRVSNRDQWQVTRYQTAPNIHANGQAAATPSSITAAAKIVRNPPSTSDARRVRSPVDATAMPTASVPTNVNITNSFGVAALNHRHTTAANTGTPAPPIPPAIRPTADQPIARR